MRNDTLNYLHARCCSSHRFSQLLRGLAALGQKRQENPLYFRVVQDAHLVDRVRVHNIVQRDRLKKDPGTKQARVYNRQDKP